MEERNLPLLPLKDRRPGQWFILLFSAPFIILGVVTDAPTWAVVLAVVTTLIMLLRERYYGDWGGFRPRREGSRDEG